MYKRIIGTDNAPIVSNVLLSFQVLKTGFTIHALTVFSILSLNRIHIERITIVHRVILPKRIQLVFEEVVILFLQKYKEMPR